MELLKTSALSSVAALVKVGTLFFLNKILSVYIGPSGFANVGQFVNFTQIMTTLGNLGFNTGVTKLTAQNDDLLFRQDIWSTSCKSALYFSLILGLSLALLSKPLSDLIFGTNELSSIFIVFGLCLPLITLNFLILAIVNGQRAVRIYVICNILGNLLSFTVLATLITNINLFGALIGLACHQAVGFIVTLTIIKKYKVLRSGDFFGPIDTLVLKRLFKFSSLAIVSGVVMASSMMTVRNIISNDSGLESAGYWDAMWRLSATYLLFVTMTLKVYLLPKFASLTTPNEVRIELRGVLSLIIPFGICASLLIYLNRELILVTLFTEEFLPVKGLFFWQLVGDILKVVSWIFAFVLLAQERFKELILVECIFCCVFPLSVGYLIPDYGTEAASIGYALSYLIHLVLTLFLLVKLKLV